MRVHLPRDFFELAMIGGAFGKHQQGQQRTTGGPTPAGTIFRQYREAKHGNACEAEIERLRQPYIDAQRKTKVLSTRDEAAIRGVLARPV